MDFRSLASLDWRAIALIAIMVVLSIRGLVFLMRANRGDFGSLQETLKRDRDDDGGA